MSVFKNKRNGRWVTQVYDPDLGRMRQIGTSRTRREALDLERDWNRQQQLAANDGGMTVGEWRDRWLQIKESEWRRSTLDHNRERTNAFVAEYGDVYLADFNMGLARRWARENPSTIGAVSAMFGAARQEVDDEGNALIATNPFSGAVKRHTYRRDIADDWLKRDDVDTIAAAAEPLFDGFGQDAAAIIIFAAETGVRPGELFTLEEADLDPAAGELIVRRAGDSKGRVVGPPKNGEARTIVLSRRAAEAAARARRYAGASGLNPPVLDARGRDLPWSTKGTPRLFSTSRGIQLWTDTWGYYWRQIRTAAQRPGMDFYDLRHYCATRLLEAGVPDWKVAVQLGHTDGGDLVRRVYGHPSARLAREAIRAALDDDGVAA